MAGPDRVHGTARPIRTRVGATALVVVLVAVWTLAAVPPAAAIHRGDDVPIRAFPFMVSLRLASTPDSPRCGGTLVEADLVLTAAHCVLGVPQRGIVVVVGADVPDWPSAPKVDTLGHAVPETFDLAIDNRDDLAILRLAEPQSSPTIELATIEPQVGDRVETVGWGCTNAPPECKVRPTTLQASAQVVLDEVASCGDDVFWTRPLYYAPTSVCTKGVRERSTINRGDSGGPLLVRHGWSGALEQAGVTTLGSDSLIDLTAGFTTTATEAGWIAQATESLRSAGR